MYCLPGWWVGGCVYGREGGSIEKWRDEEELGSGLEHLLNTNLILFSQT